jgi:hypothetical protein
MTTPSSELLKPAQADTAFRLDTNGRPALDEKREATPIIVGIHPLHCQRTPTSSRVFAAIDGSAEFLELEPTTRSALGHHVSGR